MRLGRTCVGIRSYDRSDLSVMRKSDYTDMGGMGKAFLTTHWLLTEDVGADPDHQDRALIGLLLEKYWKPVYCYLRRKGYGPGTQQLRIHFYGTTAPAVQPKLATIPPVCRHRRLRR